MSIRTQELLNKVVNMRTGNKPTYAHFVRAQLLLKGIDPDKITATSDDDPIIIQKLEQMMREFSAK